jgi:hypothetical protein
MGFLSDVRLRNESQQDLMVQGAFVDDSEQTVASLQAATGLRAGQVWRALQRLWAREMITQDWVPGTYPRKKVYRLAMPIVQGIYVSATEHAQQQMLRARGIRRDR